MRGGGSQALGEPPWIRHCDSDAAMLEVWCVAIAWRHKLTSACKLLCAEVYTPIKMHDPRASNIQNFYSS